MSDYPIVISRLNEEDGGGWLGRAVDLHGCMSDGTTPQEALENTLVAVQDWIAEYQRLGREVPEPGSAAAHLKAHIKNLSEQLDQFSDIDNRIDSVASSLAEMREELEHISANQRFEALVAPYDANLASSRARKTTAMA